MHRRTGDLGCRWVGMVVGAGLVCASMVGLLIDARLHAAEEKDEMTQPAMSYREHISRDPLLPVTFEYPSGWSLREERGQLESYRQIRLLGQRNAEDSYTAYISVSASPRQDAGGRFQTVEQSVEHYKAHLAHDAKIESSTRRMVAGIEATELMISYTLRPWHHRDLKDLPVPLRVRTVFFEKNALLFQLTSSADSRESDQPTVAFDHFLNTLRIQEPG